MQQEKAKKLRRIVDGRKIAINNVPSYNSKSRTLTGNFESAREAYLGDYSDIIANCDIPDDDKAYFSDLR